MVRLFLVGLLLFLMSCGATADQRYDAPRTIEEFENWPKISKHTYSLNPQDKNAPVAFRYYTGPEFGVTTYQGALDFIESHTGVVKLKGTPTMELVRSYKNWFGTDAYIVLHPSEKGVMVALFNSPKENYKRIITTGFDLTREDFERWEGVMSIVQLRAPKYYAAVPEDVRARIGRAPFENQVASYNFIMDKVMTNGLSGLMRLQELHYDVLLGEDVTSPFISD